MVLAEDVSGVEPPPLAAAAAPDAAADPACAATTAEALGFCAGAATGVLVTAPGTAGLACFAAAPFGAATGKVVLVATGFATATAAGCAGLGAGGGICTV